MKKFILATALLGFVVSALPVGAQSVIPLAEDADGRYTMDATVNGVGVKTYYAPENWYASMSSTTYLFLYQNGYIVPTDVNGMTTVKMPNGTSTKAASFVIRNLRLGKVIVQNLPAFVITKQNVPLVIGNAAFDCFGTVSVEDGRLIIDDRFEDEIAAAENAKETPAPETAAVDRAEQLEQEVLDHLAAKRYAEAAEGFATLQEMGVLTMYSEYQYAMVLNILRRSDDCIALSLPWLEENRGKSLTLDYWILDALGDCYARKGDRQASIRYYEEAVEAYCQMFNTTEKNIRKSKFKDETLGYTLYDLAMQYAPLDMGKTRYYSTLAAKCGNASAIEFCKKNAYGY